MSDFFFSLVPLYDGGRRTRVRSFGVPESGPENPWELAAATEVEVEMPIVLIGCVGLAARRGVVFPSPSRLALAAPFSF